MKPAKAATAAQIAALNDQSEYGFALSDEAFSNLDPERLHVGVPLLEIDDGRIVVVTWGLRMRGDDRFCIVHVDSPYEEVAALPYGEVPDEVATRFAYELRRYLLDVAERQLGTGGSLRRCSG
jgi:hypothetical protein